jgi:hypothetical protein
VTCTLASPIETLNEFLPSIMAPAVARSAAGGGSVRRGRSNGCLIKELFDSGKGTTKGASAGRRRYDGGQAGRDEDVRRARVPGRGQCGFRGSSACVLPREGGCYT